MNRLLTILGILCLTIVMFNSCKDDDDDTILVQVSVRVDLNVPEYVTVFGQQVKLSNDGTWKVTLETFRTHEFRVNKPKEGIPDDIPSPCKTNDSRIKDIFSFVPSQYNPNEDVFTLQTERKGKYIQFILTPATDKNKE